MRRLLLRILAVIVTGAVLLSIWAAVDLYIPHNVDIRDFDPDEVARLDTAMWRSYYSRQRLKLYFELTELLEKQYKLNFWRRQAMAFRAAKAAFVFKDGESRADYEKALPDLEKFYAAIRDISTTDFDADQAAKLELEWWIVHRQRKSYPPGSLSKALAETAAAIYDLPPERFTEHANLRAEAMEIRDTKAEQGGVAEEDWARIDDLLHRSWRSLHHAVNEK
ncbi:MAG: hypothetical protein IT174_02720 [Acidobacteria bacterium]|nr:hypothetical protein [Acidobacteriota bacterium]